MSGYLSIIWDGDAPYEVVEGHVSLEEAAGMLEREGIVSQGTHWRFTHTYGRWIPDSTKQYDMIFNLSAEGRGAFPVTLLEEERK